MNPCLLLLAGLGARISVSVYTRFAAMQMQLIADAQAPAGSALPAPGPRAADDLQKQMEHHLPAVLSGNEQGLVAAATIACAVADIAASVLLRQFRRQQHHFSY